MQKTLYSLLFCLLLAGCSNFGFPGVYRLDIQQGNLITQDQINQLKPGMTQAQVRYILGTPLLSDTFNPNRWEYVYSIQPGGENRRQERLTVFFEGDRLSGFSGNFLPNQDSDDNALPRPSTVAADPKTVIVPEEGTPEATSIRF